MSAPSYVHGTTSVPLLGETIGANLRRTAERHPDRDALVVRSQDFRATYAELWALTTALARALLARGVAKGDRVGIWAPNRYEWVVAQYATARVGAVLVNVNPAYKARELEYALQQSGLRMLLHARRFRATDYAAIVADVRSRCPALEHVVDLDADWDALLGEGSGVGDDALAEREATLAFDDPINIQYTSGTTGAPKGATLSHHNILNNGYFCGEILGYTEADRVAVPVPFYHCFGMVHGQRWRAPPTASAIIRAVGAWDSTRGTRWPPSRRSGARRSTACRPCSSRSSTTRRSAAPTSRRCARA